MAIKEGLQYFYDKKGKLRCYDPNLRYKDITKSFLKNKKPGQGKITFSPEYDIKNHKNEIKIAYWILKKFGGNIHLIKEVDEDKVKTPDFIWNGKWWELKSPSTINAISSKVGKGISQMKNRPEIKPGGLIIDLQDNNKLSKNQIRSGIERKMNYDCDISMKVIVKRKDKIVLILDAKYKKA